MKTLYDDYICTKCGCSQGMRRSKKCNVDGCDGTKIVKVADEDYACTKCTWSSRLPAKECDACRYNHKKSVPVVKTTVRRFVEGLVPERLNKIYDEAYLIGAKHGTSMAIIEVNGELKYISLANMPSTCFGSGAERIVKACGAIWHGYFQFFSL